MPTRRLGGVRRREQVGVGDPGHLHRVGLVGFQGVENAVRLAAGNLIAVERVLVHADALSALLVGHLVPALGDERAGIGVVRRLARSCIAGEVLGHRQVGDDVATGNVEVAGHADHGKHALASLHAIGVLVEREAPSDRRGLRSSVHAGHAVDVVDGHLADLGRLLRRHVGDALGELVEAVAPALDEVVVVEVFLDEDVAHRHRERRVGAVAQAQLHDGAGGEPVHARVDGHELRAALHKVDHRVAEEAVGVGRERHLAPENHELGHLILGVVVAAFETAGVVELGVERAENHLGGHHARLVAGVAGLRVSQVGRAEDGELEVLREHAVAAGAHEDRHGLATVLLGEFLPVVHDEVERLIPAAALPRVGVAAFGLVALHRVDDAARIVHVILERQASRAEATMRDGVVLVTLDVVHAAVLVDVDLDAASNWMAPRGAPHR